MYHILQVQFATPEYDEIIRLRYDVLREPLGLEFDAEELARECEDIHLGCYDEALNLLGCCLLRRDMADGTTVRLKQMAVAAACQRRGLGRQIMSAAESWAQSEGYTRVLLHARREAEGFYSKLGYVQIGEAFEEVGIVHVAMQKAV